MEQKLEPSREPVDGCGGGVLGGRALGGRRTTIGGYVGLRRLPGLVGLEILPGSVPDADGLSASKRASVGRM